MIAVAISGATRDWLTWHSAWGTGDGSTEIARACRDRLLTQPERKYGRGYRTTADLPDAQARELAKALRREAEKLADDRPDGGAYLARAVATDADRLARLVAAAPPLGETSAGKGGRRHGSPKA